MPSPFFVTIANGQTVSSAFVLDRTDRGLTVYCASHGPAEVRLEFAPAVGSTVFEPVYRRDGSGVPFAVVSGNGGFGFLENPPTTSVRVRMMTAASGVRSFTVLQTVR